VPLRGTAYTCLVTFALLLLASFSKAQASHPPRIVFKGREPYLSIDGYTVPLTSHESSSDISLGDGRTLVTERDFASSRTGGNTSVLAIRKGSKTLARLNLLAEVKNWSRRKEFWQQYPNGVPSRNELSLIENQHTFVPLFDEVVKKRKDSLIATIRYPAPWSGAPQRAELVRVHFSPLRIDYICPLGFPLNYNPGYTPLPRVYRTIVGTLVVENNNLRSLTANDRLGRVFSTITGEPVQLMQGRWLTSRRITDKYFACYVLDLKTRKTRLILKAKMDRLDNMSGWSESHYLHFWQVKDVGASGRADSSASDECALDVTTGKITRLRSGVDRFVGGFGIYLTEKQVNIYSLVSGKLEKSLPIPETRFKS